LPSSPSSSAQQARQALADQLREVRDQAGLTGRELAARAGWRPEKVSRIVNGSRAATANDVRTWCEACEVPPERTAELLAEQRAVAGMWVTYQRSHRAGMRQAQAAVRPVYERATLLRSYVPNMIPGLLQTSEYTRAGLEAVRARLSLPVNDINAAVAERMDRQKVLRSGRRRFVFIIEEQALTQRTTPAEAHAAQLRHLLKAMHLPAVSLSIIPAAVERPGLWQPEAFYMFDEELVAVELTSGVLEVRQPGEIALYVRIFTALKKLAVVGTEARTLITSALEDLAIE
jgi:transcriptional regulator with XRE-family HTH domain